MGGGWFKGNINLKDILHFLLSSYFNLIFLISFLRKDNEKRISMYEADCGINAFNKESGC